MKLPTETFFERIRNRLSPAEANDAIRQLKKAAGRAEVSYMAVKEASELLDRMRMEARSAIRHYRVWQADQTVKRVLAASHADHGRILHDQARIKASLYLDAMRNYRDLVRLSIAHCEGVNDNMRF